MTKKTAKPSDDISQSINRALEAASVATDSAEEAALVSSAAEKALMAAAAAQKKVLAIASGLLIASCVIGSTGAVVYLRSVADLREAAEIQAAANKATIETIQSMTATLAKTEAALDSARNLREEIAARIDGLGDRISSDLEQAATSAGQMQPQIAAAIQSHVDAGLDQTKGEVLQAIAELQLSGASPATAQALNELLADIKVALGPAKVTKSPAATPTAKPKSVKKTQASKKPAPSPFTYP